MTDKRDWGDITPDVKQNVYKRWATGEIDIASLARELGLPAQNLSRRLREMRQYGNGAPTRNEMAERQVAEVLGRTIEKTSAPTQTEPWHIGDHPVNIPSVLGQPLSERGADSKAGIVGSGIWVGDPTNLPNPTGNAYPWSITSPYMPQPVAYQWPTPVTPPTLEPKKRWIVANPTDVHGVYADPYAWELALKCIQGMNPDHITWGNDAMDFGAISSYSRTNTLPPIKDELADEKLRRKELGTAAPNAKIWWLADNHVYERYARYIYNRIPEMADIKELALHNILGVPEESMVENFNAGKTLRIIHGTVVRKWPGWSVVAEIFDNPSNRDGRMTRSIMMGHIHRFSYVAFDNNIEGLECGCLCGLRPNYIEAQRKSTNWSHGMGFAEYGEDWSRIIPARFSTLGDYLVCHLEGAEYKVKIGPSYSGFNS